MSSSFAPAVVVSFLLDGSAFGIGSGGAGFLQHVVRRQLIEAGAEERILQQSVRFWTGQYNSDFAAKHRNTVKRLKKDASRRRE